MSGDERCGMWMKVGGYQTWCFRPVDHEGECRPSRRELRQRVEQLDEESDAISEWVIAADERAYDAWPDEVTPA